MDLKGLLIKRKARGVIIISSLLFLNQLNDCYQNMTQGDLDKLISMKIIQTFLNSKFNLFYLGIELVMHVICVASVVMSVESVVVSIVSMYENRQSKFRNLGEDRETMR